MMKIYMLPEMQANQIIKNGYCEDIIWENI